MLESQQKYHDSELQKWREIIKSSVMLLDQVRLHSCRQGCDLGVTVSSQSCSPSFSISCFHHSPSGVPTPLDPSPAAGGYHRGWHREPRLLSPIRGVHAHQGENSTGPKTSYWHIWYLICHPSLESKLVGAEPWIYMQLSGRKGTQKPGISGCASQKAQRAAGSTGQK